LPYFLLLPRSNFQVNEERIDIGRIHAPNAGRLPNRKGLHFGELFTGFFEEGSDRVIIQICWQFAMFLTGDRVNLVLLF
jgi:hypothetical protein